MSFLCIQRNAVACCRGALLISRCIFFMRRVRISASLISTTQGRGIHRNSPLWGWSCPYMCRCIMGQQQADSRRLLSLSLSTRSAVFVIIHIDQSKPSVVRQEKRGGVSYIQWDSVGSSSSSIIPESQSVSQSDKFIQSEIHSWAAVKSCNCGTLCVCMWFNPSVICVLLPSHECRDFSIKPRSLWKDATISCVAHHICCWRGKVEMWWTEQRDTHTHTQKIKMNVTQ